MQGRRRARPASPYLLLSPLAPTSDVISSVTHHSPSMPSVNRLAAAAASGTQIRPMPPCPPLCLELGRGAHPRGLSVRMLRGLAADGMLQPPQRSSHTLLAVVHQPASPPAAPHQHRTCLSTYHHAWRPLAGHARGVHTPGSQPATASMSKVV